MHVVVQETVEIEGLLGGSHVECDECHLENDPLLDWKPVERFEQGLNPYGCNSKLPEARFAQNHSIPFVVSNGQCSSAASCSSKYKFSWFYWFNFQYVHANQVLVPFSTWIDFSRGCWLVAFGMTANKIFAPQNFFAHQKKIFAPPKKIGELAPLVTFTTLCIYISETSGEDDGSGVISSPVSIEPGRFYSKHIFRIPCSLTVRRFRRCSPEWDCVALTL